MPLADFKNLVEEAGHKLTQRKNTIIIKKSYFYRHGWTSQKLYDRIKDFADKSGISYSAITHDDKNNSWPKDSWFEVRVVLKPS